MCIMKRLLAVFFYIECLMISIYIITYNKVDLKKDDPNWIESKIQTIANKDAQNSFW